MKKPSRGGLGWLGAVFADVAAGVQREHPVGVLRALGLVVLALVSVVDGGLYFLADAVKFEGHALELLHGGFHTREGLGILKGITLKAQVASHVSLQKQCVE